MDYKKSRLVAWIMLPIGAVITLISFLFSNKILLFSLLLIGMMVMVTGLLIQHRYWRCPYCGQHLPIRHFEVNYCPYCSAELEP